MLIQSRVGSIGVASLVLSSIVANHVWAQTLTEPRSETAEPSAAAPVEAHPASSLTTADVTDDIWNLLNSVSDRVDTTLSRAEAARDRATEARDNAVEMVDNMQDGLQNLTGEMRERIQDAVEALQQAVLEELAGATDFTNGPNSCSPECESFRDDVITLLTSMQDISNALLAMSGINGQADFSAEIAFIESLSGKALYPLYRVLQTLPVLDEDFLTSMSQIADNLNEVAPYIEGTVVARGAPLDVCRVLADNDKLLGRITLVVGNIGKVGNGSKLAGSVLNAIGKTKFAARAGVWGFAGITYTSGLLERLGKHIESLGEWLSPIAEKVEKKLQYCVLKVNEEDIIEAVDANHQQFMQTDQAILDVLKAIPPRNGADLNNDQIVDLLDFSLFRVAFTGPGVLNRHAVVTSTRE